MGKKFSKIKAQKKLSKRRDIIYIHSNRVLNIFFISIIGILYYHLCNSNNYINMQMIYQINRIFKKFNKININDIYNKYHPIKTYKKEIIKSKIDIEFTLDPNYILETMLTVSSIMASQKNSTKIVFHFGVIRKFNAQNMLKIYSLKKKINNLTEFNFYYLKDAMKKMKNFHKKGEACPGKFELPQLLPDNVKKILLFDAGDIITKSSKISDIL